MNETTPSPAKDIVHDISKEHYEAIGRVANAWATLEYYFDQVIWNLAGVYAPIGACMTAQYIGPGPRFRAISALAKLRGIDDRLVDDINRYSQKAQSLGSKRNRWAHDPAFVHEDTGNVTRLQVTADRTLRFEMVNVSPNEIVALEKEIWAAVREFTALGDRIAAAVSPLPDKPPGQFQG